jgi:hypothetical protein
VSWAARQDRQRVSRPATDIDLSITAVRWAAEIHQNATGFHPTTLGCSPEQVDIAHWVLRDLEMLWTLVVAVPGLPADAWFVCSPKHVVWSPGV